MIHANRKKKSYRVVLNSAAWRTALRAVIAGQMAFGNFRWHNTRGFHELICTELEPVEGIQRPSKLHNAEQWIVFIPGILSEFPEELSPVGTQGGIVVCLDAESPDQWEAWIRYRDDNRTIEEIRITGARLPLLRRDRDRYVTPWEENPQRFSRQRGVIGDAVQSRIGDSSVTVIGSGGMGSIMAVQLAMLGVGELRLIDDDTLGVENLERTFGVGPDELGQPKVAVIAKHLRTLRPDMLVHALPRSATSGDATNFLAKRSDLVLTCVDAESCRLRIAELVQVTNTIHVDIGTSIQRDQAGELSMFGDIRLCLPGQGCLACIGGISNLELQRRLLRPRPSGSLPPRLPRSWNNQRAGSLVSLNTMTAGIVIQLWLDMLTGARTTSIWFRLLWDARQNLRTDMAAVSNDETCSVCSSLVAQLEPR